MLNITITHLQIKIRRSLLDNSSRVCIFLAVTVNYLNIHKSFSCMHVHESVAFKFKNLNNN